MSSLEEQVGALVRHHRERANLTQGELAELIDRQVGSVSRIERGESAPSFETLSKMAEVLKVDVRDFFGIGAFAAKDGRDDPLVSVIDRLSHLSDDDVDWADQLLALALSRKS